MIPMSQVERPAMTFSVLPPVPSRVSTALPVYRLLDDRPVWAGELRAEIDESERSVVIRFRPVTSFYLSEVRAMRLNAMVSLLPATDPVKSLYAYAVDIHLVTSILLGARGPLTKAP